MTRTNETHSAQADGVTAYTERMRNTNVLSNE